MTMPGLIFGQNHPLWAAQIKNGKARCGRVIGWRATSEAAKWAKPFVAFTDATGRIVGEAELVDVEGEVVFLGDTRDEVARLARSHSAARTER
jgi:hypothetical protein